MKGTAKAAPARLSHEEFTLRAIHKLRTGNHLGIHVVYSGFNAAFRKYFDEDPVAALDKLAEAGKVVMRPAKKGPIIYDPKDNPPKTAEPDEVLGKILG